MKNDERLARRLGLLSSIGLVIGVTIGSGIFRTPAQIAARVPHPVWMLTVWVLGGAISLCGALSVAELGASLPQTGGLYVYLREGWGRLAAFLFGWSELVLIRASALGAIATVFGEYFLRSIGLDPPAHETAADSIAILAMIVTTAVNIAGVQWGAALTGLSTLAKSLALLAMVLASFLLGGLNGGSLSHFVVSAGPVHPRLFGLALISVLWAYDGFADLSFAGGEVKDPQRNLPRALVFGTISIIVIYILTNAAYLYVTSVARIPGSRLIAADTMLVLVGPLGVPLVSIVVMISTLGALNGAVLMAPRILFAMAGDGLLFRAVSRVHPRYRTPYIAILLASALGVAFVLVGTFEELADTFVLALWPFYALSVAAVYRLRRTRPGLPRPYRVIGYPILPLIFILGVTYLVVNALVTDTFWTTVVLTVVLAGVPVYYLFVPLKVRQAPTETFTEGHFFY